MAAGLLAAVLRGGRAWWWWGKPLPADTLRGVDTPAMAWAAIGWSAAADAGPGSEGPEPGWPTAVEGAPELAAWEVAEPG